MDHAWIRFSIHWIAIDNCITERFFIILECENCPVSCLSVARKDHLYEDVVVSVVGVIRDFAGTYTLYPSMFVLLFVSLIYFYDDTYIAC